MKVKKSAIIYTGYDYQTLQGVNLLSDWLNSPTQFERMCFEADKEANNAPQGIDDIICERADGKIDFWQVKFTPSPEKESNQLTWNWLLKKQGKTSKSRSILQKLSDAVASVTIEKLGRVALLTNKSPDRLMEGCIKDARLSLSNIPDEIRLEVFTQLGNEGTANLLFSLLEVQHSAGNYHVLNRDIRSKLYKHSNDAGIDRLLNRSREWAMFENTPSPDGWIYLHQVREILSTKRPDPIPEIFSVPPQYSLPDKHFHENLVDNINSSKGEVFTITGKPGLGKSTYLSYLCQTLERNEIPLIRHHYFLSLGDTTQDRLSPRIVAESLLHQISSFHEKANADTSNPENLRSAIETCAKYYKEKNKVFVVLIDGLDHVWRDNNNDKKPLDETFRQLLPVFDNTVLLVGTQPVSDELLPDTLLSFSPKKQWLWLPSMTGNSIFEFLKHQAASGRVQTKSKFDQVDELLKNAASKLLDITTGYPLHVIYSYEYLAQNGKPLNISEIEKLPPCLDNTIETYYQTLWQKLSYKQRDVLHLCCGFNFAWPRNEISSVLEDPIDFRPSVNAVSHMLFEGISGVRPFHESLVVFIQNQENHKSQIEALLPKVCEWLEHKAPPHLKNAWFWSCMARAGNSVPLRQGLSRDWLLDRLIEGFPTKACINLLSEAETYAFGELKFDEAYKHREIKTRLINGPEFQTWDLPTLEVLSLVSATSEALNQEISFQNELPSRKLAILAISLWERGENEQAAEICQKAIHHHRAKSKLINDSYNQDEESETSLIIKAGVLTNTLNYDAIFEADNFSTWPSSYMSTFIDACMLNKDIDLLFRAYRNINLKHSQHTTAIELALIRLSIIDGADITQQPDYKLFGAQGLSKLLDVISSNSYFDIQTYLRVSEYAQPITVNSPSAYHIWFFNSLNTRLSAEGDFSWVPVKAIQEEIREIDVSAQFNLLNELAEVIALKIVTDGEVSFDFVCTIFPQVDLLDETNHESRRAEILLKRVWIEIASDCHLLTSKTQISTEMIKTVIDCDVFTIDWLRLWNKDLGIEILTDNAARYLITASLECQSEKLEETIEYSNKSLELAEISYRHNQSELFLKHLRLTWDFVLGYGHHKDYRIYDTLRAIKHLSKKSSENAFSLIQRISPIVFNASDFTEGERGSMELLLSFLPSLSPQTAASIYEQFLRDGEWYYADKALTALTQQANFSSDILKGLFFTGLNSDCYRVLHTHTKFGDKDAINLKKEVEFKFGIDIEEEIKGEDYSSNGSYLSEINIKPSEYSPGNIRSLIEALNLERTYGTGAFWVDWYNYWVSQGKESDLLKHLLPMISDLSDPWDDKRHLLDRLFISQKKFNGKTKAFNLIVAAQNSMNGWSDYYETSEATLKRLKVVSDIYPKQVDEFIRLTTIQPNDWHEQFGRLIIPSYKLVYLLSECGRVEEASMIVESMISSLEQSLRNLTLNEPMWSWGNTDTIEQALTKTLVSRLKLAVPSVKLWVMDQVSALLTNSYPNVEELILKDLQSRRQESECVEVLSLLLNAANKGYIPPIDLGSYVKARSTLSDMIVKKLTPDSIDFGEYVKPVIPAMNLTPNNNWFNNFHRHQFPQIYDTLLKREEDRTQIPWTSYFRSEWNNTFSYCPATGNSIDYFLNSDRLRVTGQFYTTASHRGRSAFLRTIEIAKQYYGMPVSYAEDLATHALPIEPAYGGIVATRPSWIPAWSDKQQPTKEGITNYVRQCLKEYNIGNSSDYLAALAMPIRIDNNTWIDLTIVACLKDKKNGAYFDTVDRTGWGSIGNGLEQYLTYMHIDEEETPPVTPLAVTSYPLKRYGHWHSELETRMLYIPAEKTLIASSNNGRFEFKLEHKNIGYSSYWYNYWKPSHPNKLRSLCGTFTVFTSDYYTHKASNSSKNQQLVYLCRATILTSDNSHSDFKTDVVSFTID